MHPTPTILTIGPAPTPVQISPSITLSTWDLERDRMLNMIWRHRTPTLTPTITPTPTPTKTPDPMNDADWAVMSQQTDPGFVAGLKYSVPSRFEMGRMTGEGVAVGFFLLGIVAVAVLIAVIITWLDKKPKSRRKN